MGRGQETFEMLVNEKESCKLGVGHGCGNDPGQSNGKQDRDAGNRLEPFQERDVALNNGIGAERGSG